MEARLSGGTPCAARERPGVNLVCPWFARSADSYALSSFYSGVRSAIEGTTLQLPEYRRRTASPAAALEETRREVHDLSDRYRAYCERVYASMK